MFPDLGIFAALRPYYMDMRKHTLTFLLMFGVLISLNACGGGSGDSPEAVAEGFFNEIVDLDFDGARKYATSGSGQTLNMLKTTLAMAGEDNIDKPMEGEFKFIRTEENGNTATVYFEADGEESDMKLKKEGGDWKVAFSKSDLMERGMEEAEERGEDVSNIDLDMDAITDSLGEALKGLGEMLENLGEEISDDE